MRNSQSHPLQIAEIQAFAGQGKIGVTFCPGKQQPGAMTGGWARDLALDLDAIADWGAASVVTLVEPHELEMLKVSGLGEAVKARHMAWHHLPIRDVGAPCPEFEQAWKSAGEQLKAQLRSGFNILVHCKGGLGRAGTIAARLMIELGVPADQAIVEVRKVRPGAIETPAQETFVRSLLQVPEPQPDQSFTGIQDRASGALLGLAVGDALGTTLEFSARDRQPRLTDMIGGGPFGLNPGEWTDDTAMALALADSLAECGGLNEADLMQRFVDWHKKGRYSCTGSCFDIGLTTRAALARWSASGNPIAGATAPDTAGNGSLMRLAPIAIRYWRDRAALRDAAARQSRTTHAAPQAVEACVAYAECLADAIMGVPRSQVLAPSRWEGDAQIAQIMAGSWRGKARSAIASSGYVVHSLEAALWSVGRSGDYTGAVLMAANLGDDADTTAAIAGQLAGALGGIYAIPQEWLAKLAWRDKIEAMADRLLADA